MCASYLQLTIRERESTYEGRVIYVGDVYVTVSKYKGVCSLDPIRRLVEYYVGKM